jgi:hypothetical protein
MDFRTEISLEELLAEPMVLALMKQDGVSIGEARALHVSVGQRLKESAGNARTQVTNRPLSSRPAGPGGPASSIRLGATQ